MFVYISVVKGLCCASMKSFFIACY